MKVTGSKSRCALIGWIILSGAMAACSGEDVSNGAGGSSGTGGTGGSVPAEGGPDAREAGAGGADTGTNRADGRADAVADGRVDASGGAGGGGGDAAADRGAGGAGGSGGDASGTGGDARAETGGGGTGGSEAGTGGSAGTGGGTAADAAEAGPDVANDTAPPTPDSAPGNDGGIDANDGSVVDQGPDISPTPDASDVTPVPPDADRALCAQPIPGGALTVNFFDNAADATPWGFDDGTMLGLGHYPPPAGTMNPVFDGLDGCPDPGQLRFTIPFDHFAGSLDDAGTAHPQGARFSADLSSADWTGRSTVHIRLMLETRGGLEFINPFAQLGSVFTENPNAGTAYTGAMLGVGVWRDLTIPLPTGSITASNMGFEVFATIPGDVVFVIDSIWVE